MKKILTQIFATLVLFLALWTGVQAQTGSRPFVIDLTINGVTTRLNPDVPCGFGAAGTWGGILSAETCLDVAWGVDVPTAMDPTPDSLNCDSIPAGFLTGKVGLARRGGCEFGVKALNLQKGGASIAVIVNNAGLLTPINSTDECWAGGMAPGMVGTQVNIPTLLISRKTGNEIAAAINAGQTVTMCFYPVSLVNAAAELQYSTPLAHRDSLFLIRTDVINRGNTPIDVTVKARITDPAGEVTEFTDFLENVVPVANIPNNQPDSVAVFPLYYPELEGTYRIDFSNDVYSQSYDSISRFFEISSTTFATENGQNISDQGMDVPNFAAANREIYAAARYVTGPDSTSVVNSITFGLGNALEVVSDNPLNDLITISLYDADVNNDGLNDIPGIDFTGTEEFSDYLETLAGFADYTIDASVPSNQLITVPLLNLDGEVGVTLKPFHFYYVILAYDGKPSNGDTCVTFTTAGPIDYLLFNTLGPVTPVQTQSFFSGGFAVGNPIARMGLDVTSTVKPKPVLSDSKYKILSNPANEQLVIDMELAEANDMYFSLVDMQGRSYTNLSKKDFQSGQVTLNTQGTPSGSYVLWVRTSKEGNRAIPVMICH
jgi:PA domain